MGHISECANNHLTGYTGLTHGSADLIVTFGSEELIEKFVPKMIAGEWAGTMCLTEPQAGSSLSDIVTSATPQEDGSYKIKGQKIFISGGDHEYCENFVHLVIARIDGAPAGTKGISLFVVPKKRSTADGLVSNDVITAGDYQKMGQKGYCTTHLVFGENDDTVGYLVGTENKGLKYMFQMMNAARIDVGYTAASTATAAYYASLQYAKERPQGRRIQSGGVKNATEEQTTIIEHPDKGRESINNGVQILGGYGYCSEFILQQYLRDIRIMAIYEGTTGIQSLDLLGRKVVMKNGEAMRLLTMEVIATIAAA
eukprot:maker-scaffold772_size99869-snap-gene-0.3 protein:Tk06379 transcript:maker-scaffold772_size99869-snap-gene-0.3-mRNA-1 annotation:"hypothetical protein"